MSPCPYCGAPRDAADDDSPQQRRRALQAVAAEVARIRELAEKSADQSRVIAGQAQEIRLLRETIARLRGASRHPGSAGSAGQAGVVHVRGRVNAA